ncbi:MAG: hypothetical protein HY294_16780 [Candidatus Rokubacteria bacterium]|nr:hypothetical protein [Candidatus Rokubacteria bacterium]
MMNRRSLLGLGMAGLIGACLPLLAPVRVPAGAEFALSSEWDLLTRVEGVREISVYREEGSPVRVDIALYGPATRPGGGVSQAGVAIDCGDVPPEFRVVGDASWRAAFDDPLTRPHAGKWLEFARPAAVRIYVRCAPLTEIVVVAEA